MQHDPDVRSGDVELDTADLASSVKANLMPRYTKAEGVIDDAADTVASMFKQGPTDDNVHDLIRAGLIPLSAAGLYPTVTLTPQDKYHYFRSRIDAGLMTDFTQMTEAQRIAFNEENPGLLDSWMQIDNPDAGVQSAVIALALPRVDGDDAKVDAQTVLNALGDDPTSSPADVLKALRNIDGINEGLALLTPWAAKHGVSLANNPAVTGAQSYLKQFVADTYDKKDELLDYINADEHKWLTGETQVGRGGVHHLSDTAGGFTDTIKNSLTQNYADAILNLSNHEKGGGYDDLPESLRDDAKEMFTSKLNASQYGAYWSFDDNENFKSLAELLTHGEAEPGDGLAKQIASTAVASTSAHESFWDNQPGGDRQDPWDTGLTADILDLVSRNPDATADLVSGTDVPDNYPSNFNATILDQPWDLENGDEAKAAKMYSWIHDDAASGDPELVARADKAFDKLSEDITSVDGDNFKHLMGDDGDSAAYRNTLITREIADALSDHLDEFASEGGKPPATGSPLSEGDRIRLMTYIASDRVGDDPSQFDYDRGAARLSAYVNAYQHDRIFEWANDGNPDTPRDLADKNGRLQAMLDSSLINEAQERGLNANDAEAERIRNLKIGAGIAGALAGKIPIAGDILGPATGIGNTLLSNLVTADHMPAPDADISADWQADGSHITTRNTVTMIDALIESGKLKPADLPDTLTDPGGASNAQIQDAADSVLTDYFKNHPPVDESFYDNFSQYVKDTYSGYNDHYKLSGLDDNQIRDFLTSGSWGRP
jgi:hypothetical protein